MLPLFQARNPAEAARKKMMFVPTVRKYIEERAINVRGYVFFVLGHYAPDPASPLTVKEQAGGRSVARLTESYPAVLYAAEMYGAGGLSYALGHQRITYSGGLGLGKTLGPLEVATYERAPRRIGFGVLTSEGRGRIDGEASDEA